MRDATSIISREAACQEVTELALKLGASPKNAETMAPDAQALQQVHLIQSMPDVCRLKHFLLADDTRSTIFHQLPVMVRALGKP